MKFLLFFLVLISATVPKTAFAIHDDTEKTKCLECHLTLPFDRSQLVYTDNIGKICLRCHLNFPCDNSKREKGFSHPIEVTPSMNIPLDMPLNKSGMMTCITCHSYHAEFWDSEYNNESLLRRTKGPKLCYTCHKKF